MLTVKQIVCGRCGELNLPHALACAFCGAPLAPLPTPFVSPPAVPPVSDDRSDLPPLAWALFSLFVAVWGLIAAGPLRWMLGPLTHPALLAVVLFTALLVTGIYLAERVTRERRPHTLLSTRDVMALAWTASALLGASQVLRYVLPPIPTITRYEIAPRVGDGCRVEVFVKGEEGDELWRLTGLNRKSEKEVVGIIVRRPGGGSARLPLIQRTPAGPCAITKYHLTVNGKEIDTVDGATE